MVGFFILFTVGLIVTTLVFWNQIFIVFFGVILVLCTVVNVLSGLLRGFSFR